MFSDEFIRPQVWHALSVHFPIALLPAGTITMLISFFVKEENKRTWQTAATLLLFAGCLMAWIAVYTGSEAEGQVARKICDPTILKDHEIASERTTWIFTVSVLLLIGFLTDLPGARLKKVTFLLAFLLTLTGTGYLIYTGHIGATLVYDQGAGVRNHEVDCDP